MSEEFFSEVTGPVEFAGSGGGGDLAYRVYDPDRMVLGKRMEDQLRIAVCYWHSFNWPGNDVFGVGTFCVLDSLTAAFLTVAMVTFFLAFRMTDRGSERIQPLSRRRQLLLLSFGAACGLVDHSNCPPTKLPPMEAASSKSGRYK